ncbi:hypothetical protein ASD74_05960 [Rhizobium sp. Root564]|nr:hypothetical protein ASD74_05960 [Rhizobium sp. Root564]
MRKIERIEDSMNGMVTYQLASGKYLSLSVRDVRVYGLEYLMKAHGLNVPTERIPVFQGGRKIGTVSALFDPIAIKSRSFFYDVRPGDFTRTADGWEASRMLGPGDLDAVSEFIRNGETSSHGHERMVEEAFDVLRVMAPVSKQGDAE